MPWVYDPHSGGLKIPERTKTKTRERILAYAEKHYHGKYIRIDVRFRSPFCYIDAYIEPVLADDFPPPGSDETREEMLERKRNIPMHLCRLRHFSEDRWSVAYYSYSRMAYRKSFFENGEFEGTPEEGFEVGAVYLGD
ncbi:hypothetical protein QUF76_16340 [Desulfobacterales bacterium HSG16]|nr:hypothetical protein [Desulfobacterales bacterium HSG16]